MPYLTEAENAYLIAREGRWVRVTPKFRDGSYVGRVVGWHWYDGVVLHVQPAVTGPGHLPAPYRTAFEFDTVEPLGEDVAAPLLTGGGDDVLAAVRALHIPDPDAPGFCGACGLGVPCATARLLTGGGRDG